MPIDTIPAPLAGKIALITGGSQGLGQAFAIEFAKKGCSHIAITYLSTSPAKTLDAIKVISPSIITYAVKADINDDAFGSKVVTESMAGLQVSHLDIVVANAALVDQSKYLPIAQIDKEKFDFYMRTTCWASMNLAMSALPHIRPHTDGRIIFISSGGSKQAFGDPLGGHCMAKAALDSLSSNLGKTYGKEKGMTINSIGVGVTETDAWKVACEAWPGYKGMTEKLSPLERAGTVQEVARIVSFVASPEASWICGNQVPANWGMLGQLQV